MKKLVAALLVLTMVLAMCSVAFAAPQFTEDDIGKRVKFKGSLSGYDKPLNSAKSKVIIRKGSVSQITDVKGDKWVKVAITFKLGEDYDSVPDKQLWFGQDKLELTKQSWSDVVFAAGGSGNSEEIWRSKVFKSLVGKIVKTSGKVKLRKTASLAGKCQGVVKKGTKLKLTGIVGADSRGICFFQVKYNGKKYFVSAEYIKNGYDIFAEATED